MPSDSGSATGFDAEPVSLRVAFAAGSVPLARTQLQSWMEESGASEREVEDARLVISELVANAVRHATPLADGMLLVAWALLGGRLHMSVSDGGGPSVPHVIDPPPLVNRGRGMGIVESLSDRWWVTSQGAGRTTHALIALH
jgi:serine/threonine-protein kinase RsbW